MDFIYEKNRIMLPGDNGAILAEVSFPDVDTDTVNIDHTFVDDSLSCLLYTSLICSIILPLL